MHDQKNKKDTEIFKSAKVVTHPLYNRSTLDYDYAVIQLNGDSKFRTIDLNRVEIDIPEVDAVPINVWTSGRVSILALIAAAGIAHLFAVRIFNPVGSI